MQWPELNTYAFSLRFYESCDVYHLISNEVIISSPKVSDPGTEGSVFWLINTSGSMRWEQFHTHEMVYIWKSPKWLHVSLTNVKGNMRAQKRGKSKNRNEEMLFASFCWQQNCMFTRRCWEISSVHNIFPNLSTYLIFLRIKPYLQHSTVPVEN